MPSLGIQLNTFDEVLFYRENPIMEHFRDITRLPNRKTSLEVSQPLSKIVFGATDPSDIPRLAALLREHPDGGLYDYIHSERSLYEILPKGAEKGDLLLRMADLLGIDRARTIAVGDYDNDISMIQRAGLGFAVANAVDGAKAVADFITVDNNHHAIAEIIRGIDSGKYQI